MLFDPEVIVYATSGGGIAPGLIITNAGSLQGFKMQKLRVYVLTTSVPSGWVTLAVNVKTVFSIGSLPL